MKKEELNQLSLEDLQEKVKTERNNLQNLLFAHSISPLENPLRIRQSRKQVARLETLIRNRELNAVK